MNKSIKDIYTVKPISNKASYSFLLQAHYAHRLPSISYAFGLLRGHLLMGVCTFGTPASSTLLRGVCGVEYKHIVKELNRLVINNAPNLASFFVSRCFKLLPSPLIIVSYADASQVHHGYVYQACNFIYTGLSSAFRDPKVKGLEHQHHATYAHGLTNKQLIEKYGDRVYFIDRARKHRYIYFIGNKRQCKQMKEALRYPIKPYPKGDNIIPFIE